eukprot:s638_g10.t1
MPRDFLRAFQLYLPATTGVHKGEQTTWCSPFDGSEHCIDYVALPQAWRTSCQSSRAMPDLDIGHHHDHTAIACEVSCCGVASYEQRSPRLRCSFDRRGIQVQSLAASLEDYCPPAWQSDIETQVDHFNEDARSVLAKTCPIVRNAPKKHIFDEATWALRLDKLRHTRHMKQLRKLQDQQTLALVFHAWHRTQPADDRRTFGATLRCRRLHLGCQLQVCARQLRSQLRLAKRAAFATAIEALPDDAAASTILPLLGPSIPKKRRACPLPVINNVDGSPRHFETDGSVSLE